MWDAVYRVIREPLVTAVLWLALGLMARYALPRRMRVAAVAGLGGASAVTLSPAFAFLAMFGSSILVGLAQSALLFANLTLFFAPLAIALDRVAVRPFGTLGRGRRGTAYAAAVATGLVTCLASVVALWWVTDVKPDLLGSVEVAVFGGVATACVALVRVDRNGEAVASRAPIKVERVSESDHGADGDRAD